MRVILACAIVALLPAAPAVLAAKDGPDDAVAEPQGGFLQRFGESLGDYNRANAPGLYDAQSRALSAMGIGGSVAVQMDGTEERPAKRFCVGTEGADGGECQLLSAEIYNWNSLAHEIDITGIVDESFATLDDDTAALCRAGRFGAAGETTFVLENSTVLQFPATDPCLKALFAASERMAAQIVEMVHGSVEI